MDGTIFLRLAVGIRLIQGTQDNVFSWERMVEFAAFLDAHGFPLPLVSAVVSAWAQFLCGICFVLGLGARPTGALMAVNFLVALGAVHLRAGDDFLTTWPAAMMLAGALFLLCNGAGAYSLDRLLARRRGAADAVSGRNAPQHA
jgi:putative oxidoreductase